MIFPQTVLADEELQIPSINIKDTTYRSITVEMNDNNPKSTKYQILVIQNGVAKYVSTSGYLTDKGKWITLSDKTKEIEGLEQYSKYIILARAQSSDGEETVYGDSVVCMTDIDSPYSFSMKSTRNTIELSWEKVEGAYAYEIEFDGDKYVVYYYEPLKITFNDLQPDTTYVLRVRTISDTDTYSEWTDFMYPTTKE
jgi:hypothetical protein